MAENEAIILPPEIEMYERELTISKQAGLDRGYLTYDELKGIFSSAELEEAQIKSIVDFLATQGVRVSDEDPDDQDPDDAEVPEVNLDELLIEDDADDVVSESVEDVVDSIPESELNVADVDTILPKITAAKSKRGARRMANDPNIAMLTGDPVRMYLKEIGRVPLLSAAEEIDLAMKIEKGLEATKAIEDAIDEGIELPVRERNHLAKVEQVGLNAKQDLIEANLR
ncbi:MAG: hypothetical protein IKE61_03325, partial [Coriobacteriales bacterium]|nr:hypothetical protein [Coriobacteriales bacterium]